MSATMQDCMSPGMDLQETVHSILDQEMANHLKSDWCAQDAYCCVRALNTGEAKICTKCNKAVLVEHIVLDRGTIRCPDCVSASN